MWVYVHEGNTNTYNRGMSDKDSGASGMPVKRGAVPAVNEDGEPVSPAIRIIDNVMKGMRLCCRGKGKP
ncbi:uncharacterized protein METZ01_LOCUS277995 [marine metagenome]|uniref:Uncharacterized protein n=1 Tax=marine metagenome TaxID=408172 RepID=A0A382KR60_9ZZZZ